MSGTRRDAANRFQYNTTLDPYTDLAVYDYSFSIIRPFRGCGLLCCLSRNDRQRHLSAFIDRLGRLDLRTWLWHGKTCYCSFFTLLIITLQELKILRLADSVLDILVCLPSLKYSETAAGWHDALFSLSRVLHTVGGQKSPFLATLQRRMVEINFPINIPQELESPVPNAWVDAPKALLLGPPEVENGPKANANDDLG